MKKYYTKLYKAIFSLSICSLLMCINIKVVQLWIINETLVLLWIMIIDFFASFVFFAMFLYFIFSVCRLKGFFAKKSSGANIHLVTDDRQNKE